AWTGWPPLPWRRSRTSRIRRRETRTLLDSLATVEANFRTWLRSPSAGLRSVAPPGAERPCTRAAEVRRPTGKWHSGEQTWAGAATAPGFTNIAVREGPGGGGPRVNLSGAMTFGL